MDAYLAGLATESISENTRDIDLCSTREMVEMMNREDARVAEAVHAECDHIAQAVDLIYGCLRRGGRLGRWSWRSVPPVIWGTAISVPSICSAAF